MKVRCFEYGQTVQDTFITARKKILKSSRTYLYFYLFYKMIKIPYFTYVFVYNCWQHVPWLITDHIPGK